MIEVTTDTFEQDVIERSHALPVVVDFSAAWCGPCRALGPALEAEEAARDGEMVLAKVDVDANRELAARHGIQGIPAVKAFRDGEVVDEFVSALPRPAVSEFLDRRPVRPRSSGCSPSCRSRASCPRSRPRSRPATTSAHSRF